MRRILAALAIAAPLAVTSAGAHHVLAGAPEPAGVLAEAEGLVIADGAARAAGPTARSAAGYFTVTNGGDADDRLLAAESPAATRVELHAHMLEDGVARMVEIEDGIPIPAGATVDLAPGGLHLMFLGLTGAWDPEAGVPVTLAFERAGPVELVLPVAAGPAPRRPGDDRAHDDAHGHRHGHGDGHAPPAGHTH